MSSNGYDSIANAVSTGSIIAIVIGTICGLAFCIGCIVVVICIIKHGNRRRYPTQGMVLRQPQPQPYIHPWTTDYPPNTTSVSNYPPQYQSDPPPYTASASAPMKSPYT